MRICRVPGCGAATSRFGLYCSSHKARSRRHGDVIQRGVTVSELKPYLSRVRARIAKNADNPTWATCDARWAAIVEHASDVLAAFNAGRAGNRFEREAAREITSLADRVQPRAVVETALAMYMMQELDPRRFASDDGFMVQLARRVRGLTEASISTSTTLGGRQRRAYRDVSPKVSGFVGQWIAEALAGAGLIIARLETKDLQRAEAEKQSFAAALSRLS